MTAPPETAAGRRMVDLEGYRGLGALGVVVFHAYQFCRLRTGPGGVTGEGYAYAGTPVARVLVNLDGLIGLFLLLSGFVLYRPVAARVLAGRPVGGARVFLIRRAVRILPLYWFAIALVWSYRNPAFPGDWRDLVEHLTFTQVFDSRRVFYTIGPAWSLSVEVFFYAFLGLALVAFSRRDAARGHPGPARSAVVLAPPAVLLAASLAYQGWAVVITHQRLDRWAVWFNPLPRAEMFAAGMFLAVAHARRPDRPLAGPVLLGVRLVAATALVVGVTVRGPTAESAVATNALTTAGFALLMASSVFASPRSVWRRCLGARPLVFAGTISYSTYLWHEPVLLFLDTHHLVSHRTTAFVWVAALLVTLSMLAGWLSYLVIERPARELTALFDADGRLRPYYGTAGAG